VSVVFLASKMVALPRVRREARVRLVYEIKERALSFITFSFGAGLLFHSAHHHLYHTSPRNNTRTVRTFIIVRRNCVQLISAPQSALEALRSIVRNRNN
jgi:hypothetical protein